ncbi:uncharacterized protein CTRU02_204096 [Colletotrichum truncatum]|uniref:Uncharacterized protein n=1 Tax=Colletotrichum truncatum TaxID=5467 RepID=A0ACC3ZB38_COLTU
MNQPPPRFPARPPFKWDHAVYERDTEEPSRLDTRSGHKAQFGDQATHESLLDLFLDTGSFSLQSAYEPSVFKRIFKEDTLENIRDGKHGFQDPQQLVAWLHDRNCDNQPRPTNGSKTGEEFLKLIKLKVCRRLKGKIKLIRSSYIPNPNESALGILALRASEHQTPAIKSLIFKHLEADTSISLQSTVPEGEFILEFHMPYFAWRKTSYLVNDSRTLTNNNPLRRSFDLSFLSETKMEKLIVEKNNYLYEAHTAFCITGRATSVWTAVCLADTFFDEQDPNNEQMLSYYTNNNDSDPMFYDTDALSVGELTADGVSVTDPREYFLLIAKSQVKKAGKEWKDICGWLKLKVEEYVCKEVIQSITCHQKQRIIRPEYCAVTVSLLTD